MPICSPLYLKTRLLYLSEISLRRVRLDIHLLCVCVLICHCNFSGWDALLSSVETKSKRDPEWTPLPQSDNRKTLIEKCLMWLSLLRAGRKLLVGSRYPLGRELAGAIWIFRNKGVISPRLPTPFLQVLRNICAASLTLLCLVGSLVFVAGRDNLCVVFQCKGETALPRQSRVDANLSKNSGQNRPVS